MVCAALCRGQAKVKLPEETSVSVSVGIGPREGGFEIHRPSRFRSRFRPRAGRRPRRQGAPGLPLQTHAHDEGSFRRSRLRTRAQTSFEMTIKFCRRRSPSPAAVSFPHPHARRSQRGLPAPEGRGLGRQLQALLAPILLAGDNLTSPRRVSGLSTAVSVVLSMASRSATGDMAGGSGRFSDISSENWPLLMPRCRKGAVEAARKCAGCALRVKAEAIVANMLCRLIGYGRSV